jgi:hypothetical protein
VLIGYIECHIDLAFTGEVTLSFHCYCVNIDFVNIYFQIAYIEYQIVTNLYEVLTKIARISFLVVLSQEGAFSFLWLYLIIGCLAGTI